MLKDSEGYIVNLDGWSEDFVCALAMVEGLELTKEHWQVVHNSRGYWHQRGVEFEVRKMVEH